MIGLPQPGDRVKVYPAPGRQVQNGARPIDSGGRFLPEEGAEVDWTLFHLEQLRCGDIMFSAPPKQEEKAKAEPKVFDFAKATEEHLESLVEEAPKEGEE